MPVPTPEEDFPLAAFASPHNRVSKATLIRAANAGELVAYKVGREYRVTREAFDEWYEARRVPVVPADAVLPDPVQAAIDDLVAAAPPLTPSQIRIVSGNIARRLADRGAIA